MKRRVKGLKTIHEVEERVYGCPPEERQTLRLARSLPVLEKIRADLSRVEPDAELRQESFRSGVENRDLSG